MTRRSAATFGRTCAVLALCSLAAIGTTSCGRLPSDKGPLVGRTTTPTAIPTRAIPLASKVTPPPSGAYLGVFAPPAPFDGGSLDLFEKEAGKPVSIVMWYQPWAAGNRSGFDVAACLAIMRRGSVPMISWEPWDPGTDAHALPAPAEQPAYRFSAIIGGTYDPYIRVWARQIRDLGGPVMLRPMHEMNGNWYPWGGTANGNDPSQYVTAWRHVHDIFTAEGATNVTWVWSINGNSVPDMPANRFAAYYPGDRYVDWTAISVFNRGSGSYSKQWYGLASLSEESLSYLAMVGKPICLAEFGSVEQGGDKAAWLTDAFELIEADGNIKAVVYYNAVEQTPAGTFDWRIDSSPASLKAYRAAVAPDHFVGSPPPELRGWVLELTDGDWRRLVSVDPRY